MATLTPSHTTLSHTPTNINITMLLAQADINQLESDGFHFIVLTCDYGDFVSIRLD